MSVNQLTEAELERLALLAEEMGETIQIIGKILRHGYESSHPTDPIPNRKLLELELGDVLAALNLMYNAGDINYTNLMEAKLNKLKRVWKYLHHQKELQL
jgi:NTP pyrophosphatase (non-canonical NTP hydrolase)